MQWIASKSTPCGVGSTAAKKWSPGCCPEVEAAVVGRMVAFAPSAIARTRLVIVARASWSWAAAYRFSSSMSLKLERSSWPGGVKSYTLPCDERSRYSVPRNVTLAVGGDCRSGVAAASAAAVIARANAKKMDRRFIISFSPRENDLTTMKRCGAAVNRLTLNLQLTLKLSVFSRLQRLINL